MARKFNTHFRPGSQHAVIKLTGRALMTDEARYFQYQRLAQRLELTPELVHRLVHEARDEFPDDEMLAELYIIRALRAAAARKKRSQAG